MYGSGGDSYGSGGGDSYGSSAHEGGKKHGGDSAMGKLMEKAGGLLGSRNLEERGHERRERKDDDY